MITLTLTYRELPNRSLAARVCDSEGRSAHAFPNEHGLVGLAALGSWVMRYADQLGIEVHFPDLKPEPRGHSVNPDFAPIDADAVAAMDPS